MVKLNSVSAALLLSSFSAISLAHPEDHEMHDALHVRDNHAAHIQRRLANCANDPKFLALQERGMQRRSVKAQQLRQARGISDGVPIRARHRRRDLTALEAFELVNHNMTSQGYTEATSASTLFASYKNASCILTPEVTYGPYYVLGEYIRNNVTDGQEGIPVHLEYQYIDVSTCEAATGLWLETWNANSTGVYSGISANGNGNQADTSNLDNTFLRGVTQVDDEGIGYFDTLFPGHYQGRATHTHLLTHMNGTQYANGTFQSNNVVHVGQLFFPEDLKDAVEATYPYNTNTQAVTTNDEDMWAPAQADNNYDPFPDYAYLGSDISDGLLMWISIGIDMNASYTADAAGKLTAEGGTSEETEIGSGSSSTSAISGGGGNSTQAGGAPNGTAPDASGAMGSGAPSGSGFMSGSAPSGSMGGAPSGSMSAAITMSSSSALAFSGASSASSSVATSSATVKSSGTSSEKSSSRKANKKSKTTSSPSSSHKTTTTTKKTKTHKTAKGRTTTPAQKKHRKTTTKEKKHPATKKAKKHRSTASKQQKKFTD